MPNASEIGPRQPDVTIASCPAFAVEGISGPTAARDMLAEILTFLEPLQLGPEEAGTVELVLAEVLNNVVEHAYPESDAAGPITVECVHRDDGLHLRVRDHGRIMPHDKLPDGQIPNLGMDIRDLPEGGFGWFLIHDLARDVRYQRLGCQNRLDFRIAVGYQKRRTS